MSMYKRYLGFMWIAALSGALMAPVASASSDSQPLDRADAPPTSCRLIEPVAGDAAQHPAGQKAICTYDQTELYSRLKSLIAQASAPLDADRAIRTFGLPQLTTRYASTRQTNYMVSVSGTGGWSMLLWIRESAFPVRESEPPVFKTGPVPERIVAAEALDYRYNIRITPPAADHSADKCLTIGAAAQLALNTGWKDDTIRALLGVTDGGPGSPHFVANNGRAFYMPLARQAGDLPTPAEMSEQCVTSIGFMQPPIVADAAPQSVTPQ